MNATVPLRYREVSLVKEILGVIRLFHDEFEGVEPEHNLPAIE